jgi:hypothetical protein
MKTDTELETLLRATLATHALDVHEAAGWTSPDVPQRRKAPWLPALAAAAVVLVAAGVILGIRATRSTPPTHPSPRPTHPSDAHALHAVRCVTPLPPSWRRAISDGTVSEAGKKLVPLAVDDAGDVLADRAADVAIPHTHQLVVITRAGKIRVLYDNTPPASWNGMRLGPVSTEGDWVAFALEVQAVSGGQGPVQVELANIRTGATRTLHPTLPNSAMIVLGPTVSGGYVYWTELDMANGHDYGPIYRYDIATRTRRIVATHATTQVLRSGGGVYWERNGAVVTGRRGTEPPGFDLPAALLKDLPVRSSGDSYVWQDPSSIQAISGWQPGMAHSTTVVPQRSGGRLTGITAGLVWWDGGVADLRTGASARIDGALVAGGNTAAVQVGRSGLSVVDTATLPELHC